MSNLLRIYNENFGYQVATNGTYIAVGNPNSQQYSCQEGYSRIGEVLVYRKNQFGSNYSLVKKYRRTLVSELGFINSYYTEQSSSAERTASIVAELELPPPLISSGYITTDTGSLLILTSSLILEDAGESELESLECDLIAMERDLDIHKYDDISCDYISLEDGSSIITQTGYGRSVAMCGKYMAIGDMMLSEVITSNNFSFTSVDVYQMYDSSISVSGCDIDNAYNFVLPTKPFCTITGSLSEQFGKSIAISNRFLLIGAPAANNNNGVVYIYEKSNDECEYYLHSTITSGNPGQKLFGSSVAIDKSLENKIAVGTLSTTHSMVCVFKLNSEGSSWRLVQSLQQNTSSKWLSVTNGIDTSSEFYPLSQIHSRYGYSVALNGNGLVVGAPNDLVYLEYSGSKTVRQRGAFYFYYVPSGGDTYNLYKKCYGDISSFKDNMLGYSVDLNGQYLLAGSPKPYFPFSSLYLSSSVDKYNTNFEDNDFGTSTFNGQVLLYQWNNNECSGSTEMLKLVTNSPIAYRKRVGECFSAFGASVAISDKNLVVGSPTILNDDMYLKAPIFIEQSGSFPIDCVSNSQETVVQLMMEDEICSCDGINLNAFQNNPKNPNYDPNNPVPGNIVYVFEDFVEEKIYGRAFIYDFNDLKTDAIVGNVFYNNGRIVINNTGSVMRDFMRDARNRDDDYIYGTVQSQITLTEKQYVCTIEPGEFNISTNPTAIANLTFPYGIINKFKFDFSNLDIILRYINYKLTTPRKESWWDIIISDDVQQSIFSFFVSNSGDYTEDRLTSEILCALSTKNLDINGDGVVDYADAFLIWNYYIGQLDITNFKQYTTQICTRRSYDDIIKFLDVNTGKNIKATLNKEFFSYHANSSVDSTGSYLAPYITQIGLYAGADLVSIGKIANPIKNTGQIPINIVVKWDT